MALNPITCANGQLPSSEDTLYTASGPIWITGILLTNLNSSAESISIRFQKSAGNTTKIIRISLEPTGDPLLQDQYYFDELIAMANGDKILGIATDASQVDYTITGGQP